MSGPSGDWGRHGKGPDSAGWGRREPDEQAGSTLASVGAYRKPVGASYASTVTWNLDVALGLKDLPNVPEGKTLRENVEHAGNSYPMRGMCHEPRQHREVTILQAGGPAAAGVAATK